MPIPRNKIIAVVTLVAIVVATALILCVGPAHMFMGGSDMGDGFGAFAGHSVFVGMSASSRTLSPADLFGAALAVVTGVILAVVAGGIHRPSMATAVFEPDDPRHGRLLI